MVSTLFRSLLSYDLLVKSFKRDLFRFSKDKYNLFEPILAVISNSLQTKFLNKTYCPIFRIGPSKFVSNPLKLI